MAIITVNSPFKHQLEQSISQWFQKHAVDEWIHICIDDQQIDMNPTQVLWL